MPRRWSRSIRSTVLLVPCLLTACGIFGQTDQGTQTIIDQRLIGMPMGEFIDSFGVPRNRSQQLDGTTTYYWASKGAGASTGFAPLDDASCSLTIVADTRGRIISAQVILDDPGPNTSSLCEALFKKK
jgi:hypothetical protein